MTPHSKPPVVAGAGRRIDASGSAEARFPFTSVDRVRREIKRLLGELGPHALVASAACGADLLMLEAAAGHRIRTRIVLPFVPAEFRAKSVTDRPGSWGPMFNEAVQSATARGDLIVLKKPAAGWADPDTSPYLAANERILEEALRIAGSATGASSGAVAPPVVLLAWDRIRRVNDDITDNFRRRALDLGFREVVVDTR